MSSIVKSLQDEERALEKDLEKVRKAIAALDGYNGLSGGTTRVSVPASSRGDKPRTPRKSGRRARVSAEDAKKMVFDALTENGPMSAREVEAKTGLNYAAVRRQFEGMSGEGLITQVGEGKRNATFQVVEGASVSLPEPEPGNGSEPGPEPVEDPTLSGEPESGEPEQVGATIDFEN